MGPQHNRSLLLLLLCMCWKKNYPKLRNIHYTIYMIFLKIYSISYFKVRSDGQLFGCWEHIGARQVWEEGCGAVRNVSERWLWARWVHYNKGHPLQGYSMASAPEAKHWPLYRERSSNNLCNLVIWKQCKQTWVQTTGEGGGEGLWGKWNRS